MYVNDIETTQLHLYFLLILINSSYSNVDVSFYP